MGQVIYEFIHQGRYVKVSAIDVESGLEVSIVGDPKATNERLQQLALQKLNYRLSKDSSD